MSPRTNDPLSLELGPGRVVRAKAYRSIPVQERILSARGFPQAVVKVSSYGKGVKKVKEHVNYITRNGKLELETERGEILTHREDQQKLVEEWSFNFGGQRNSRDTANIVFSMPPKSPPDILKMTVREVAQKRFGSYSWAFAMHLDTDHPHIHLVVKTRPTDLGPKLRLGPSDLYELRSLFAEVAREKGVVMSATPRWARGQGFKSMSQQIYFMRQRGKTPDIDHKAVKEALEELQRGKEAPKPWEEAMARHHAIEKQTYVKTAQALRKEAERHPEKTKTTYLEAAKDLEHYGQNMKAPQTKRMAIVKGIYQEVAKQKEKERERGDEMGL